MASEISSNEMDLTASPYDIYKPVLLMFEYSNSLIEVITQEISTIVDKVKSRKLKVALGKLIEITTQFGKSNLDKLVTFYQAQPSLPIFNSSTVTDVSVNYPTLIEEGSAEHVNDTFEKSEPKEKVDKNQKILDLIEEMKKNKCKIVLRKF
jgi:hypothetical protein